MGFLTLSFIVYNIVLKFPFREAVIRKYFILFFKKKKMIKNKKKLEGRLLKFCVN